MCCVLLLPQETTTQSSDRWKVKHLVNWEKPRWATGGSAARPEGKRPVWESGHCGDKHLENSTVRHHGFFYYRSRRDDGPPQEFCLVNHHWYIEDFYWSSSFISARQENSCRHLMLNLNPFYTATLELFLFLELKCDVIVLFSAFRAVTDDHGLCDFCSVYIYLKPWSFK